MHALNVSGEIRPTKAGHVAAQIWAIVPQEEDGILKYFGFLVFDAQIIVRLGYVLYHVVFESLIWPV